MQNFKGWEILIILVLILVLFGAKRLPDAARGLGRSLRIFKAETKGLRDDDKEPEPTTPAPTTTSTPTPTPPREIEGTTHRRDQSAPPRPVEHKSPER